MLRDLTVQNYRCFENFHIDGLERVNLFVGNNNSGKTSLLEAIYLLINIKKTSSLIDILVARGEIIEAPYKYRHSAETISLGNILTHVEPINHIFYNHQFSTKRKIEISSSFTENNNIQQDVLTIDFVSNSALLFNTNFIRKNTQQLSDKKEIIKLNNDNTFIDISTLFELTRKKEKFILITDKKEKIEQMMLAWNDIYLTDKEDKVVQALQIIEPRIERIGFSKIDVRNVARFKISEQDKPVPISSMGDGIYRLLNIAISLTKAEYGVLLVDEIETGLHYEAQIDMWRLILETAKELNVQVFATTHSWDCIAAFQEALEEVEDQSIGKLFRLDSKYGKLRAVEYNAEDLEIAVRQGIEVR